MASGEKGYVYVLVEHKSYQDGGTLYQIFSYMASIWQKYVQDGEESGRAHCAGAGPASNYSHFGLHWEEAVAGTNKFCGHDRDR